MTYYEHALMQVRKFKALELFQELIVINRFIDASKYLFPYAKHRILLHHTYGAKMAVAALGDFIGNGILVRDIVFEHCREDHGLIPTLDDWARGCNMSVQALKKQIDYTIQTEDASWLHDIRFTEKWMYTPDKKEIEWLKSDERFKIEEHVSKQKNIQRNQKVS